MSKNYVNWCISNFVYNLLKNLFEFLQRLSAPPSLEQKLAQLLHVKCVVLVTYYIHHGAMQNERDLEKTFASQNIHH